MPSIAKHMHNYSCIEAYFSMKLRIDEVLFVIKSDFPSISITHYEMRCPNALATRNAVSELTYDLFYFWEIGITVWKSAESIPVEVSLDVSTLTTVVQARVQTS